MHVVFRVPSNRFGRCILLLLGVLFVWRAGYGWCLSVPAGSAGFIRGDVSVEREGRQSVLAQGDSIFVEDRLRTGPGGSIEVVLVDESRIKLAENTFIEVTEYQYDPTKKLRHAHMSLFNGKVQFIVQEFQEFDDTRFRVETQVAVVESRDTDFIVVSQGEAASDAVCRDGLVEVLCVENAVVVLSSDFVENLVVLAPNMISRVCGHSLPTPPRFAGANELASILKGLDEEGNVMMHPSGLSRDAASHGSGGDQLGTGSDSEGLPKDILFGPPSAFLIDNTGATTGSMPSN
jgi:hypothetical protein